MTEKKIAERMNSGKSRYSIMPLLAMRRFLESEPPQDYREHSTSELLNTALGCLTEYLIQKTDKSGNETLSALLNAAHASAMATVLDKGLSPSVGGLNYPIAQTAAVVDVMGVFEAGAKKYPVGNYHKGFESCSLADSAVRHITKRLCGQVVDSTIDPARPQDLPTYALHSACVLTNVLLLIEQTISGDGEDTRAYLNGRFVGHPDTKYYRKQEQ